MAIIPPESSTTNNNPTNQTQKETVFVGERIQRSIFDFGGRKGLVEEYLPERPFDLLRSSPPSHANWHIWGLWGHRTLGIEIGTFDPPTL